MSLVMSMSVTALSRRNDWDWGDLICEFSLLWSMF